MRACRPRGRGTLGRPADRRDLGALAACLGGKAAADVRLAAPQGAAGSGENPHTRGGLRARAEDESLDAARFERLLSQGRAASRERNPALAASLLRRALGLWRGQAYGDFAYEEFARAEAERLEELRLVALEERIEAELALGRHDDLLPELRSLAAAHPGRERLQAQAIRSLYQDGLFKAVLALRSGIVYPGKRAHRAELLAPLADRLDQFARLPLRRGNLRGRLNDGTATNKTKTEENDGGERSGGTGAAIDNGQILFSRRWIFSRIRLF